MSDLHANHIAIIGLAGRFPKSPGLAKFWQNIRQGRDCITRFSDDDLRNAGIHPSLIAREDYIKAAPILENIDRFDADFFNMSPAEAEIADPQQRLLLECAWEAFESAGYDPRSLEVPVGVYCGMNISTYLLYNLMPERGFQPEASLPLALGNDKDYLATFLAYKLNLTGPAVCLQTACSTSLVAVHQACQGLLSGETDMALAGGVAIRVPQIQGYYYRDGDIASPDGKTRSFAEDGAGTLFGSGAGLVLLKRLDDALADGDHIDAVILGSAVNNDGNAKVGFSAPSVDGQAACITEALAVAGVDADSIGLIEAHGTATNLGDPIELNALQQVFGAETSKTQYCAVGSVKSNMGHLETAAGITGLIKAVYALKNQCLPPSLHADQPTSRFDWENSAFYLNKTLGDWPRESWPRRAGVSSFGMGGTNAHVVLEEAPASKHTNKTDRDRIYLLPLSAGCENGLRALCASMDSFLAEQNDDAMADIAFSASTRRAHHNARLTVAGTNVTAWRDALSAYISREQRENLAQGSRDPEQVLKPVFVFPGQGSQWLGMGRELMVTEPIFMDAIEAADAAFRPFTDWSLIDQLKSDDSRLKTDVDVIQPTLCAIQIALAALWRHYGVEPAAVIGLSMGEVAAAAVAGALSLEDAARVICLRSQLVKETSGKGAMALVELSADALDDLLNPYGERATVAALNGPSTTLVSAEPDAMDALLEDWQARDVFCRRVKVDYASHCAQMDPILPKLHKVLAGMKPRVSHVPIFSTLRGEFIDGAEMDANYWAMNLRQPVLFLPAIQALLKRGHNAFFEISPHPIMLPAINDTIPNEAKAQTFVVGSLERNRPERSTFLTKLGQAFCFGSTPAWDRLNDPTASYVRLPHYPWQRSRYWVGGQGVGFDLNQGQRTASPTRQSHTLLGQRLEVAEGDGLVFWQRTLRADDVLGKSLPRTQGTPAADAGLLLSMLSATAADQARDKDLGWQTIHWAGLFGIPRGNQTATLQTAWKPLDQGVEVVIAARTGQAPWKTLLRALGSFETVAFKPDTLSENEKNTPRGDGAQRIAAKLAEMGRQSPQTALRHVTVHGRTLIAAVEPPVDSVWSTDLTGAAMAQAAVDAAHWFLPPQNQDGVAVPYHVTASGSPVIPAKLAETRWLRVCPSSQQIDQGIFDADFFDSSGQRIASWPHLHFKSLDETTRWTLLDTSAAYYETIWQKESALATPHSVHHALLIADGPIGDELAAQLRDAGYAITFAAIGANFEIESTGHFRFNPTSESQAKQLVAAMTEKPDLVIYALPLDSHLDNLADASVRNCAGILHMVSALQSVSPPRWITLTSGVHPIFAGDSLNPAASTAWGMAQNLCHEHPEMNAAAIDLPAQPTELDLNTCITLLADAGLDSKIGSNWAIRDGESWQPRLTQREAPVSTTDPLFRSDSAYLITGGTGGLGRYLAARLARAGAGTIVVTGRREPDLSLDELREQCQKSGSDLIFHLYDVADPTQGPALIKRFGSEWPPLRGVFHLAAVIHNEMLIRHEWASFRNQLLPKVKGTWHLHQAVADCPLDHFVLFSSAASLLGSHGQSAYTAGNQFLDSFAAYRRASGQPALAVNWGAWGGIGQAAKHEDLPVKRFAPEQGFTALTGLLGEKAGRAAFIPDFDPTRWYRAMPRALQEPFLSHLSNLASAPIEAGALRTEISAAEPSTRLFLLESRLREMIAALLRTKPVNVKADKPLKQLGFNSLMALTLRGQLTLSLSTVLPATLVFNYPTLEKLVPYLLERITSIDPTPMEKHPISNDRAAAQPEPRQDVVPSEIDHLTDEESEALLLAKLDAYEHDL